MAGDEKETTVGSDNTLSAKEREERRKQASEASWEEAPHNLRFHPDGKTHRMMTVARQNGSGEREITVEEWETNPVFFRSEPGAWRILKTEAIGPVVPTIY